MTAQIETTWIPPLLGIELYLHVQADACRSKGQRIIEALDAAAAGRTERGRIEGKLLTEQHAEFWFWVLGAYEFTRNISEQWRFFSEDVRDQIAYDLTYFTKIRVPFAKLQYPGRAAKGEIAKGGYLSIVDIRSQPLDLVFAIGQPREEAFKVRGSIERFMRLVDALNDDLRPRISVCADEGSPEFSIILSPPPQISGTSPSRPLAS